MDNELQVLPIFLPMLVAVVQLISACYNATTADMHTRENIIRVTPVSSGVISLAWISLIERLTYVPMWKEQQQNEDAFGSSMHVLLPEWWRKTLEKC